MDVQRERIQDDLRGILEGTVNCDLPTTLLYSTDGGIHQLPPMAVVCPRSRRDIVLTVQYAAKNGWGVHPRGAGSFPSGESLGEGIVLDCSRFMCRVLEADLTSIRVQPGVVRERLNAGMRAYNRMFGPDGGNPLASTIGGQIAVNSAGSSWIKSGTPADLLLGMRAVLADGSEIEISGDSEAEDAPSSASGASSSSSSGSGSVSASPLVQLKERLAGVYKKYHTLIDATPPHSSMHHAGFNLNALRDGKMDLLRLLAGSEGALAIFTELTLKLQPIPQRCGANLYFFDSLKKAADAAVETIAFRVDSCDLMDRRHLHVASEQDVRLDMLIPPQAEAALLVYYSSDNIIKVRDRLRQLTDHLCLYKSLAFAENAAFDDDEIRLFSLLRGSVQPLSGDPGGLQPIIFVDDATVNPRRLDVFIQQLLTLMQSCHVMSSIYCHAPQGQIHLHPLLNMRLPEQRKRLEEFAHQYYDLVWDFGGYLGREHGCGLSRLHFLKEQSEDYYEVYAAVKRAFDPEWTLQPGKIVTSQFPQSFPYIRKDLVRPLEVILGGTLEAERIKKAERRNQEDGGASDRKTTDGLQPNAPRKDADSPSISIPAASGSESIKPVESPKPVASPPSGRSSASQTESLPRQADSPSSPQSSQSSASQPSLQQPSILKPTLPQAPSPQSPTSQSSLQQPSNPKPTLPQVPSPQSPQSQASPSQNSPQVQKSPQTPPQFPPTAGASRTRLNDDNSDVNLRDITALQLDWRPETVALDSLKCTGCGYCRSQSALQRSCPLFRLDPQESLSPRAKSNLIRSIVMGQLELSELLSDEVKQILDGCFNCRSCQFECPVQAPVPQMLLQARGAYVSAKGLNISERLFAHLDRLSRLAIRFRSIAQFMLKTGWTRRLLDQFFGLAQNRKLPGIPREAFLDEFGQLPEYERQPQPIVNLNDRRRLRDSLFSPSASTQNSRPREPAKVMLFVSQFANYHDTELARAAVQILERNHVQIHLSESQKPSGITELNQGLLESAAFIARHNVNLMLEAIRDGYKILSFEPADTFCLKYEYPILLDNDEDSLLVSENTFDMSQYLWQLHTSGALELSFQPINMNIAYHAPCRLRALNIGFPSVNLLGLIPELKLEFLESGCCGMAGAYGLMSKNYHRSLRIGMPLIAQLRNPTIQASTTECSSCRIAMEHRSTKTCVHPLKLIAYSYGLLPDLLVRIHRPGKEYILS